MVAVSSSFGLALMYEINLLSSPLGEREPACQPIERGLEYASQLFSRNSTAIVKWNIDFENASLEVDFAIKKSLQHVLAVGGNVMRDRRPCRSQKPNCDAK
jgi:hypothetical protein